MRAAEIAKYAVAYRSPGYGMGDARRDAVHRILASTPVGSLLDVGAGRGETLSMATGLGFGPVTGTEVVPGLIGGLVVYGEAHELPFGDQTFDVVTCFDVLEHLLHEDQGLALQQLVRVARRQVIVTTADYSHIHDGVELHGGRRSYREWEALIDEHCRGRVESLGWCGSAMGWRITVGEQNGHRG